MSASILPNGFSDNHLIIFNFLFFKYYWHSNEKKNTKRRHFVIVLKCFGRNRKEKSDFENLSQ